MKNFLINWKGYLYCMWLGGAIPACFGVGLLDWRFWVVVLPTVAAVTVINENCSNTYEG